jgi:hypothetical protein
MTPRTTLGGLNRNALLRVWFLFYLWVFVGGVLAPQPNWRWLALVLGSALTWIFIYRRNRLGGIVGFIVCGAMVIFTLPEALAAWGSVRSGAPAAETLFGVGVPPVLLALYRTANAIVPAVVLGLHVASRHRLLRAFEESVAERRHGKVIAPSSYYLITRR